VPSGENEVWISSFEGGNAPQLVVNYTP
jgi:hypothetical protein